jgi:nicotinamide-nucleotide amidase
MLEQAIREYLAPRAVGAGLYRRVLKITGLTESEVDARSQPVYGPWSRREPSISTTILASMGQIELRLAVAASSQAAADAVLDSAVQALQDTLGDVIYSVDNQTLEGVTGELLRRHRWTIAVGESCSGGLLASRLTDVPGSSEYFERAAVCYSNRAKSDWLGVPPALINAHGAVSEPVALAMAQGARRAARASVGVGITGIAGPGGGTAEKPVGTVAIAVSTPVGERVRTFRFVGGREMVKFQSTQAAMNMLRLLILEIDRNAASH